MTDNSYNDFMRARELMTGYVREVGNYARAKNKWPEDPRRITGRANINFYTVSGLFANGGHDTDGDIILPGAYRTPDNVNFPLLVGTDLTSNPVYYHPANKVLPDYLPGGTPIIGIDLAKGEDYQSINRVHRQGKPPVIYVEEVNEIDPELIQQLKTARTNRINSYLIDSHVDQVDAFRMAMTNFDLIASNIKRLHRIKYQMKMYDARRKEEKLNRKWSIIFCCLIAINVFIWFNIL